MKTTKLDAYEKKLKDEDEIFEYDLIQFLKKQKTDKADRFIEKLINGGNDGWDNARLLRELQLKSYYNSFS